MKNGYNMILKRNKLLLAALALLAAFPAAAQQEDSVTVAFPWQIDRPFWTSPGSSRTVGSDKLQSSAVQDLRGRLTGTVQGLEVTEAAGEIGVSGSLSSLKIGIGNYSLASKGFESLVLIVDDVPVPFNQLLLDADQIESVTLLSDVASKAIYGPVASYGAIYVKTKKGGYNKPMTVSIDAESGISAIDRMPGWVGGYDYARLNNAARQASGYPTLYSDEALAGYSEGNPFDKVYPNVDWRSLMIREVKPVTRFGFNISGGSAKVKYNATLSGLNDGDIAKVGPVADFNKLNLSTSVSAKIGRYIEATASFTGSTSFRRRSNTSFTAWYTTPSNAFPLALGKASSIDDLDDIDSGTTVYAVSRVYGNNPYAKMVDGGSYSDRYRSGMFNAAVDIDFSFLLKGLKSRTFVNLNSFFYTRNGQSNDYLAYYWSSDNYVGELSSHKGVKQSDKSVMANDTYQSLNFYERLTYDWAKNGHKVSAGAMYYLSSVNHTGSSQAERQQNLIVNAEYSWKDRYSLQAVLGYSGTSRLKKGHRYDVFPAGSFVWTLSNEPFMQNAKALTNAKVYASAGLIGAADVFSTGYLYQANYTLSNGRYYGPSENNDQWFGGDRDRSEYTTIKRLANPELGWAKIFQVEAGIDLELMNCLDISLSYFRANRFGIISDVTSVLSGIYGMTNVAVYDNYAARLTNGGELSIGWHQSFGDFRAGVRASAMSWELTNTKVVADFYEYDYQRLTGAVSDAIWGLECIGRYETQEQLETLPKYSEGAQLGDLIYRDRNDDGKVDVNDRVIIGHSSPRLRYAVNLQFGWKGLELNVTGTGRAFCQTVMNNEWFWNGWGDGNYSTFVRDNIGGAYPRLGYEKSTNNFVTSSFWVKNSGWFKIQDVELAYGWKFPKGALKGLRVSLRGNNLCTISPVKDVDPECIDSGVTTYPLFRTFTAGVKLNF